MVSADKSGRRGCARITGTDRSLSGPPKIRTRVDIGDVIFELVKEGQQHDHERLLSSDATPWHTLRRCVCR
jgi:hypothetical protein